MNWLGWKSTVYTPLVGTPYGKSSFTNSWGQNCPQSRRPEKQAEMKVLVYSHVFAPSVGGVETYVMLLARGLSLSSCPRDGERFEVTVATRTPAGAADDRSLPFRVVRRPRVIDLFRLLRATDLVHLAGPSFLPLILGWLLRKPIVIEHHGYPACCPNGLLFYEPTQTVCPGHFMAGRYKECLRCNAQAMGRLESTRVLMLTFPRRWLSAQAAANAPISRHVSERLRLPRSEVIYYGIPDQAASDDVAAVHLSPAGTACFAYVGRLVSLKGLPLLLDAAKRLAAEGYIFRLKFIGDGLERGNLEELALSHGLKDRVEFTGSLRGEALRLAMEDVAAVVMPSIWEETAGLAAIEQMMRGRLVVAADIGGLGEIVDGGGLKFPPGDVAALAACLKQVLEHPETTTALCAAARGRAQAVFGQQRMVDEHIRLYRRLATRPVRDDQS